LRYYKLLSMKKRLFTALATLACLITMAQEPTIVPKPQKMELGTGTFTLDASTTIVLNGSGLEQTVSFLNDYLKRFYGFSLKTAKSNSKGNSIVLNFEKIEYPIAGAYRMEVKDKEIYIAGDNKEGVFYGIQTLIQLLPTEKQPSFAIPQLSIEDAPRFAYRGLMLDACRHFMPVDFVKRYIDYIALFKLNTFHWHLTDDQGWRIEIKKYPKLTTVGAWRDGSIIGRYPGTGNDNECTGGFYTQEQIKEVVKYAAARHVTIIPEIEMPGHASAAIAAYPFLSCFPKEKTEIPGPASAGSKLKQKDGQIKVVQETWGVFDDVFAPTEETFKFLEGVLDEVVTLFPSKTIHVGGDECPKVNWKRSEYCQQLIKSKGLKDEHGLQSYFITRMEKYLNKKGRNIIGWDEILEGGLAPNATVMSWRGEEGGIEAARQKHNVVMTPTSYCYLDYSQSKNEDSVTIGGYVPLEKVYNYDPLPAVLTAEEQKYILGAQSNVWTEYMLSPKKVEYMIFPRLAAMSEVLWTNKENKSWENFEARLPNLFKRLDLWKTNYSKAYFDLKGSILPTEGFDGLTYQLESKDKQAVINVSINGATATTYTEPLLIKSSQSISAYVDPKSVLTYTFSFNKATGKKISITTLPSKSYAGNGGVFGLVNGLSSTKGLNSAEWLGWEGGDLEAVIDLGTATSINELVVGTIESKGSWIYHPSSVELATSTDGLSFTTVTKKEISTADVKDDFRKVTVKGDGKEARYIKVIVKNFGIIPTGMPGADHNAWLFVDEIQLN
jgi:hexosaminidase